MSVSEFYVAGLQYKCMFWIYILENQNDKSWYIGYTSNLQRRLKEHQNGYGCQTTSRGAKQRGEALRWELIYCGGYRDKRDAEGRERFLKSGSGRKFLKKQMTNYLKT